MTTIRFPANRSLRTRRKRSPTSIQQLYEQVYGLFVVSGYKPSGKRAQNINTIDEVPDSSWFTNRIGTTTVTAEQLARGPIVGAPPDPSKWVVIREKTSGAHPGFTARDGKGETWFLEFDPPYFPEGATSAVEIATQDLLGVRLQPGRNLSDDVRSEARRIRPEGDAASSVRRRGRRSRGTISTRSSKGSRGSKDGTYRVVAGRLIPGKILGNFLYSGTRPDDPNDLVPHEHRRELRALRVFGAWTNLTDWKAANTLDALDTVEWPHGREALSAGRRLDLRPQQRPARMGPQLRALLSGRVRPRKRFFSFGFALSPWQTIDYVEYPSVGKFEGDRFDPRSVAAPDPDAGLRRVA